MRVSLVLVISLMLYLLPELLSIGIMIYLSAGIIGGTISEAFKAIGVNAGIVLVCLVWLALLTGLIILFYKLNNNVLKYLLIILIAAFLYVIDMAFAVVIYPYIAKTKNIIVIINIITGFLVLLKSVILSWIIYIGIIKNRVRKPLRDH